MNRWLIILLVLVALTMLVGFIWSKLGKGRHPSPDRIEWPSEIVEEPSEIAEDEKESLIYIGDIPKGTELNKYTLVWGDYAPNYPVRLPPGTRFSKTGAIILPSRSPTGAKALDNVEEILLGSVKPSWSEISRLQSEGYGVHSPISGPDMYVARRKISAR